MNEEPMFPEIHRRAKKKGQPPGTPIYTGERTDVKPTITVTSYSEHDFHEVTGDSLDICLPEKKESGITWVNVEGLQNVELINEIANRFKLHPLTVEDILNVGQRPKVEEFEKYVFVSLKILLWQPSQNNFLIEQMNIVFGEDYVLSFQEYDTDLFENIQKRLQSSANQRLRKHGSDYLTYRLIDAIVDEYFVVLEVKGDDIETLEENLIANPTPANARRIYRLKREMLLLRKAIWPMREAISHLTQTNDKLITKFTAVYLRDVYDHVVQAIDSVETFRDMLSSMLDMYLSSLTNRMNEIMKTLTIISTIFIPITTIASIYGMNFKYMPELEWRYGYFMVLCIMLIVAITMVAYFRRHKWL